MATQVVNLLHYRSLDLGSVPPNLEFGQFGINTYNANNPVSPNLREVYLFVGTGGNDRVDEDGTDLTATASTAGSFSGEALVNGKGWVRFNLRSLKTGGDSITGDLTMSGSRIVFEVGASGNAELILPDESVAVTATLPGSIRYNTLSTKVEVWNGTIWASTGGLDFQINTGQPTQRPDGAALVSGDLWWKNDTSQLYIWDGTVWQEASKSVDVQLNTVAQGVRSTGANLVIGDLWFNFLTNNLNVWDGGAWQRAGHLGGDFQEVSGVSPTVRSTSDVLQPGDFWVDSATGIFYYRSTAGAWEKPQPVIELQPAATAPATKANGDALIPGDQWYNSTGPSLYFWDGAAWISFAALI